MILNEEQKQVLIEVIDNAIDELDMDNLDELAMLDQIRKEIKKWVT